MVSIRKLVSLLTILTTLTLSSMTTSASEDGDHEMKKNIVGVFGGFTSVSGETKSTYGIEYERRINEFVGLGLVFEKTPNAHHGDGTNIYMGQLHLHPWKELRLSIGYGKEDILQEGAHSENVWRLGAAYDFHVGKLGIAPSFNLDRVGGHTAKVFGAALTKAF